MKKISYILLSMIIVFTVSSAPFQENKQYETLSKQVITDFQVLEFFSFYCPHCYQFDTEYQIIKTIKAALPKDIKIARYHVSFDDVIGYELTRAWIVAVALGVEDKIAPLMFTAVQKTQTIKTVADIRKVFIQAGIKGEDYDSALNSFVVKTLITQQKKVAINFNLKGVPAIFINGRYMIKNEGIDISSKEAYVKQYTDVIKFLLNR
ncbi:thiol:disulfide interchange protein DsbA [Candidatus Fukatsuia anoeciicola]|uniref:thiol:disulfide interchange protein DsbA n=1 Tax=Candidatus Fukatsuia anoeciicola TaxID=2994492 RepID=UPI003464E884